MVLLCFNYPRSATAGPIVGLTFRDGIAELFGVVGVITANGHDLPQSATALADTTAHGIPCVQSWRSLTSCVNVVRDTRRRVN